MVRLLAANMLKAAAGRRFSRGFASSTNDKLASLCGQDFMSTAQLSCVALWMEDAYCMETAVLMLRCCFGPLRPVARTSCWV